MKDSFVLQSLIAIINSFDLSIFNYCNIECRRSTVIFIWRIPIMHPMITSCKRKSRFDRGVINIRLNAKQRMSPHHIMPATSTILYGPTHLLWINFWNLIIRWLLISIPTTQWSRTFSFFHLNFSISIHVLQTIHIRNPLPKCMIFYRYYVRPENYFLWVKQVFSMNCRCHTWNFYLFEMFTNGKNLNLNSIMKAVNYWLGKVGDWNRRKWQQNAVQLSLDFKILMKRPSPNVLETFNFKLRLLQSFCDIFRRLLGLDYSIIY